MKISIVTVCFNEEKSIAKTINSVLRQSDTSYEYIICDGKSTDKTVEIAESYRQAFIEKGIDYIVKSEKDGGIYFGMNNGIDLANGDYVIFMNAGDCLHGTEAIKTIVEKIKNEKEKPDVIYGSVAYVERGFYKVLVGDHNKLKGGMSICHQGILVSLELLKKRHFDTRFKIGADYDLTLDLFLQNKRFLPINEIVSDFYAGGISNTKIIQTVEESFEIRDGYSVEYDRESEIKKAKKDERSETIKIKMPYLLWKLMCKLKKRGTEKELAN